MQPSLVIDAMGYLMNAILALSKEVSPEKLEAVATRVLALEDKSIDTAPTGWFSTSYSRKLFDEVLEKWQEVDVSPQELAGIIRGSSYTYNLARNEVSAELVWTGPTTPMVPTRQTEQALLEVINAAKTSLFITSFVAYKVPSIVNALDSAIQKGVAVSMLLESSDKHGGAISVDAIGEFSKLLPQVAVYHWADKTDEFEGAKVHAKVAVADQSRCFISSANLTGYAMDKNMEAGVIIEGGSVPMTLYKHLNALVTMKVIVVI